ncbi:hypothetical protein LX32DRAFT_653156 [Colletotrichum zoysiae]|uniref:Uncharacterized protein n=1 Tax=Colletotrichum zoysiae TaxID=1216348 RepID=A0AAD9HFW3_9PEZI|nr:hypothetical protein LX32DRAFT_653156 [Colletotrichum zoysiae]
MPSSFWLCIQSSGGHHQSMNLPPKLLSGSAWQAAEDLVGRYANAREAYLLLQAGPLEKFPPFSSIPIKRFDKITTDTTTTTTTNSSSNSSNSNRNSNSNSNSKMSDSQSTPTAAAADAAAAAAAPAAAVLSLEEKEMKTGLYVCYNLYYRKYYNYNLKSNLLTYYNSKLLSKEKTS